MAVYLLHSTVPLLRANGGEVRHYLGYCGEGTFDYRLFCHQQGRHSAKIVQAFLLRGGDLWLGNYWPELTRDDERRMKKGGHLPDRCLVCRIEALTKELHDRTGTAIPSPRMPIALSSRLKSSSPPRDGGETTKEDDTTSPPPPQI